MRPWAIVLLVGLVFPNIAFADVGVPGFSRVPRHLVLEVSDSFVGYRYYLVSQRGTEVLDLARGKVAQVDGRGRDGGHRDAYVVAVPVELADRVPRTVTWDEVLSDKLLPGVLRSNSIDFRADVPFYDSRKEVIDTYRLELVPGERLQLVWVSENTGSVWLKIAWATSGILAVVGLVWLGGRLFRRRVRVAPPGA